MEGGMMDDHIDELGCPKCGGFLRIKDVPRCHHCGAIDETGTYLLQCDDCEQTVTMSAFKRRR